MLTAIATEAADARSDADTDLDHIYCCDENLALCGVDLSRSPEIPELINPCVVCLDLEEADVGCRACATPRLRLNPRPELGF